MTTNFNFQLGLLEMVHLLANADGYVDENEKRFLWTVKGEEEIPDSVYSDFEARVSKKPEQEIYKEAIDLLNECTEDEKLCIFVHLYRLAKADNHLNMREIRFLLYGIKATRIEFTDVELSARLFVSKEGQA